MRRYRADFPQLGREWNGQPLIYLDSAATALKPNAVIDAVCEHYRSNVAAVHRATHALGELATAAMENARKTIAEFVGAKPADIAFTRSATEAVNLVAASLHTGAVVTTPATEHHSNLLPWRRLAWIPLPVDESGRATLANARDFLVRTRPHLLGLSMVSNAFGIRQPVEELLRIARQEKILTLLDISQAVGLDTLDLAALDCDLACFSGHKMLGPSGVGVLYVHERVRNRMQPLLLGGGMVAEVSEAGFAAREFPHNLEAGSPNVEGAVGLAAAARYLRDVGVARIAAHVAKLAETLQKGLREIKGVRLVGRDSSDKDASATSSGIVSFVLAGASSFEVARILSDSYGIMLRAGHHCAQLAHAHLNAPPTLRASMHLYNTPEEMIACIKAVREIAEEVGG